MQPGIPKVPKIKSLHIFAISPENHRGEVGFLPANEHESFLQVDSITLGLRVFVCVCVCVCVCLYVCVYFLPL